MHLKYDIICALACLAMERVGMLMLLVSVVQSAVDSLNDNQCSDKCTSSVVQSAVNSFKRQAVERSRLHKHCTAEHNLVSCLF